MRGFCSSAHRRDRHPSDRSIRVSRALAPNDLGDDLGNNLGNDPSNKSEQRIGRASVTIVLTDDEPIHFLA